MTPNRRLRVLEVARGVAGPACGRLFAGLGHDVIKCEIGSGDPLRHQAPYGASGDGLAFAAVNADKKSVRLEHAGELPALLDRLAGDADVLILDLLPAEVEALGWTDEALRTRWPELVIVWITGFGRTGEYADVPGDSLLAEAYGGLATMIGRAGQRPLSLGGEQTAYCAGVTGFFAALIALLRRDQGHGGDLVDVAMCDVAAYMDWKSDVALALLGTPPRRRSAAGGEWKMLRARDGWVGAIFQQPNWPAVVEMVGDPLLRDPELANEAVRLKRADEWWPVLDRWAAGRTAEDIYTLAQRFRLPFGWAVGASDLVRSEQLRFRGFVGPVPAGQLGRTPAVGSPAYSGGLQWSSGPAPALGAGTGWDPRPEAAARTHGDGLPLADMTVLDFGTITAGAAATRLLADHGATILKVEWIDRPDTFRSWKVPRDSPAAAADSPYFLSNNVGKLDVALDLKQAEGQALVAELARASDVVVENFRVGVTGRLGIDRATLAAVNPELIHLSLSSQGQHGPESRNSSYGSTLDLLSGLASVTGYEPDQPMWSSSDVNYPDQLVSLLGAAFVAYCWWEGRHGLELDVSQREAVSWTLDAFVLEFLVDGRDSHIDGNRRPGRTPHDTFPARGQDSWLALSCWTDADRAALAGCIGAPELAARDREWWLADQDRISTLVGDWTGGLDRDEAVARLRAAGVAAVPVLDALDRARTPRFTDNLVTLPDVAAPTKGFPMRFRDYRMPLHTSAPAVGQDTAEVLTRYAGLDAADISRLRERRVVHVPDRSRETGVDTCSIQR